MQGKAAEWAQVSSHKWRWWGVPWRDRIEGGILKRDGTACRSGIGATPRAGSVTGEGGAAALWAGLSARAPGDRNRLRVSKWSVSFWGMFIGALIHNAHAGDERSAQHL